MTRDPITNTRLSTLLEARPPDFPQPAEVMTGLLQLPPGDAGSPPHRHSGPVFGYVTEGELVYEIEGEPERVIAAGEAFWEPGGERIHYQAANNLADGWTRFVAVMIAAPGKPMLTLVDETELVRRGGHTPPAPA